MRNRQATLLGYHPMDIPRDKLLKLITKKELLRSSSINNSLNRLTAGVLTRTVNLRIQMSWSMRYLLIKIASCSSACLPQSWQIKCRNFLASGSRFYSRSARIIRAVELILRHRRQRTRSKQKPVKLASRSNHRICCSKIGSSMRVSHRNISRKRVCFRQGRGRRTRA